MNLLQGLQSNAILIGVLAYIANMAKGWIFGILDYIMRKYTSYIEVDDQKGLDNTVDAYKKIMCYIINLNDKVINNSKQTKRRYSQEAERRIINFEIAPGRYFIKLNIVTYATIYVRRESLNDTQFNRSAIRIVGFSHLKYAKDIAEVLRSSDRINSKPKILRSGASDIDAGDKTFDHLFIENKDQILSNIDTWINSKDFYNKHAITYKLGILLHGEPGTGKSSFITALANYLKYDIQILKPLDLYNITSGNSNKNGHDEIFSKTIIVLEDVDCLSAGSINRSKPSKDDDDKENGSVFINELLQLLDGVASPHNVIFVLTTNHKDRLDPALLRPGRITLDIELGKVQRSTAIKMCDRFEVSHDILADEEFPINPSYLQNKIILEIEENTFNKVIKAS